MRILPFSTERAIHKISVTFNLPYKKVEYFFNDRINHLNSFFLGFWPVIVGIAFEMSNRLKDHLRLAWKVVRSDFWNSTSYPLDWPVTIFIAISFLWGYIFYSFTVAQDRATAKKFATLQSAIIKAPDFKIYMSSRLNFNSTIGILNELEKELGSLEKSRSSAKPDELKSIVEKETETILVAINTIHELTISLASLFFHRTDIEGANIMLFFESNDENASLIQTLISSNEKLYFRDSFNNSLNGVLYLVPELMKQMDKDYDRKIPSLVLPVYDSKEKIYNDNKWMHKDVIIPGATLALRRETSMIGDTKDIDEYYYELNTVTKEEIRQFFSNSGKDVRSFASFRIPDPINVRNCIGVLNLDSSVPYSFGEDQEFFGTFYSMVYPSLVYFRNI